MVIGVLQSWMDNIGGSTKVFENESNKGDWKQGLIGDSRPLNTKSGIIGKREVDCKRL